MKVKDKKSPNTQVLPATATNVTKDEALAAVKTLIKWIGDNSTREGLLETPARVIKSYEELFSGYKEDPVAVLQKTFEEIANYDEMVLVKNIRIESYCEHHMLPIIGTAHIAYIPNSRIVGLSKLARVADIFAKRLQTQELLTVQIANTINQVLKPKGVAVIIDAYHQCMTMRGVNKHNSTTITTKMTGSFQDNPQLRTELFTRINQSPAN